MIHHLLTSRPTFYRLEGLHGQVDNHGGNRISQKVIDICKKMAKDAGMDGGVVQEIINQSKGIKRAREASEGEARAVKKPRRFQAKKEDQVKEES